MGKGGGGEGEGRRKSDKEIGLRRGRTRRTYRRAERRRRKEDVEGKE